MDTLNYDKSLWLILEHDKNNRRKILDFLMSFPSELYNEMVKVIADGKKNIRCKKYGNIKINGIIYYYEYNLWDKDILISRYSEKNMEKEDIFVLKLYPYNEDIELNKSIMVGKLIYQLKENPDNQYVFDCNEISYGTLRKISGTYFVKTSEDYYLFPQRKSKFSLEDIPSSFDIKSFYTKDSKTRKRVKNVI